MVCSTQAPVGLFPCSFVHEEAGNNSGSPGVSDSGPGNSRLPKKAREKERQKGLCLPYLQITLSASQPRGHIFLLTSVIHIRMFSSEYTCGECLLLEGLRFYLIYRLCQKDTFPFT